MRFGWKVLIPVSIVWVIVVAVIAVTPDRRFSACLAVLVAFGFASLLLIIASYVAQAAAWIGTGEPRPRPAEAASPSRSTRSPVATPCRRCPARSCSSRVPSRNTEQEVREQCLRCSPGGERLRRHLRDPCSARSSPSSTPRRSGSLPSRATTAGTSSTVTPTASRSASAASCARGPARPTRSSSRAPTTRRGPLLPGRALRPGVPDQLPALHRLRAVHRGLPDPGPDDDQRVYELADDNRAEAHLREGAVARPAAAGMVGAAARRWSPGPRRSDYYQGNRSGEPLKTRSREPT
jgi:hypothetical protein